MKCIICDKIADEVGSHLIPASLIKNCVGKHYREESYSIINKTSKIDKYYGRDNLKNELAVIKQNPYKRDNILCKVCEKKLADLESKFAVEFLHKFRENKYSQNFISSLSNSNLEILEPIKILNLEILAYFYSIIYRFCCTYKFENNDSYIEEEDLLNIKHFLKNYLIESNLDENNQIEDYKLVIIFNRYSTQSSFITSNQKIKNPYTFYFCDAIVIMYIGKTSFEVKALWADCLNSVNSTISKIIIGPSLVYEKLTSIMSILSAEDFMSNGIKFISELNNKSFQENEMEFKLLVEKHKKNDNILNIMYIFNELKIKYTI